MERILNAIVYAALAGLGTIIAGGVPQDIVGWCGIALAVITAGWGKYTTNTELVWPPDRKPWTEEQRRIITGAAPNRPAE